MGQIDEPPQIPDPLDRFPKGKPLGDVLPHVEADHLAGLGAELDPGDDPRKAGIGFGQTQRA
jgi:hypothetical protein